MFIQYSTSHSVTLQFCVQRNVLLYVRDTLQYPLIGLLFLAGGGGHGCLPPAAPAAVAASGSRPPPEGKEGRQLHPHMLDISKINVQRKLRWVEIDINRQVLL